MSKRPSNKVPEQGTAFGRRLRHLRQAAGLTQEELARRAGLTPNAVSALERGARKRPYPHTVRSLADALELSVEERAALLAAVPKSRKVPPGEAPPTSAAIPMAALPDPATLLLGREREMEEIANLVGDGNVRLVTLTGIGGVGKTRLAVEVARETAGFFPDGAAFVELAPLVNPAFVTSAILRSLGLSEAEGPNPGESLAAHLRERRLLLVLDNFEHLLDATPEVAHLIEACPRLVVLATSRAPLRVRGEQEYPVPPLGLPPSTRSPDEHQVLNAPSGRLFLERVRAVSPGFRLTPDNAGAVAAICWRLAGLPLALELAAAKARFLAPQALLSRLDGALSAAWTRDLPQRQRTMQAALDWSYELLSEPQRELFLRLSVLSGFSLEAAETLGAGVPGETLDQLGALVEQSLVSVVTGPAGVGVRYGMLEPVRQYAREKLQESGESEDALRRHAAFFLGLAEAAASELWGPRQAEWLERLESESPNYRAVMARALEAGESETTARIGWALWSFWWVRGYHQEGRRWMEATLEGRLSPYLWARALMVAAAMAYTQGDYEAAGEYWAEGLRLAVREGDEVAEGYAEAGSGLAQMSRAQYEAADSRFRKALPIFEQHGEEALASLAYTWLGTSLLARGNTEQAERMFEDSLELARRTGSPLCIYVALYNLAQVALWRGDLKTATRLLGEGIELSEQTKDRANLAHFLEALAAMAVLEGKAERSAVLIGASEGSLREVGAPVYNFYVPDPSLRERATSEARASLGEASFEEAREWGQAMTFEQTITYALQV